MKEFKAKFDLFPDTTPRVFADGTAIYDKLAETYKRHDSGYFILAPSGSGKTYYVTHQEEADWLDGDDLWMMAHAHPEGAWWLEPIDTILAIDARSDAITAEAKKLGFWIVGASNNWLKPDAIVVPDEATHKAYIASREDGDYDGGATSDRFSQVLEHIAWMRKWVAEGVPEFKSVAEAADYLAKQNASS